MAITPIVDALRQAVPDAAFESGSASDQPTIYVPREWLLEACRVLRDAPEFQLVFLAEVTAVDWWPREPRFEVVYHLASLGTVFGQTKGATARAALRVRLKVRVPGDDARVPSVSGLWPSADWPEREVWDLFGISFDGHPALQRLLMPEDWEGHPLRKDYPVQIDLAAKTYEPLQLSEEQFRANIQSDRDRRAAADRPAKDRERDV